MTIGVLSKIRNWGRPEPVEHPEAEQLRQAAKALSEMNFNLSKEVASDVAMFIIGPAMDKLREIASDADAFDRLKEGTAA